MLDKIKLDQYLRANGGLSTIQGFKFFYWSFLNFKKCLYFYKLCEEGQSNFVAFNKADRDSKKTIQNYLIEKKY